MEIQFLFATLFNLGINLVYTIIALFIGVGALLVIDKKLMKNVDIEEELRKGNIAIAIFASTILMFIALIISFGLKG
jgi:ABC-type phosphate transport system permease subunit